jgi:hypothetical protein
MSALAHPNTVTGTQAIPGGPAPGWVEEMRREYGEDSSFFISRVLAEFPTESTDQAIPTDAIEAAFANYAKLEDRPGAYFRLGIDPAGPGEDHFVVATWRGRSVVRYDRWRRLEAPESAERIMAIAAELMRGHYATFGGSTIRDVSLDEIGIGHGIVGILRRSFGDRFEWPDVRVHGVNVAKRPGQPNRFVRRRDELVWHLREDLVEGRIAFAPNKDLAEEIAALRVRQTVDGRVECEPKDAMRSRLGRSPDVLDAVLVGTSPRVAVRRGRGRVV